MHRLNIIFSRGYNSPHDHTRQEQPPHPSHVFRLAPRYDLMNRLMTLGQDVRWRWEVIRRAQLVPGWRLLDLGSGTGDLAREAQRQQPGCLAIAADYTLAMMRSGNRRGGLNGRPPMPCTFPFKMTISTPRLRFPDAQRAGCTPGTSGTVQGTQAGGRIVILDTTRPKKNRCTP